MDKLKMQTENIADKNYEKLSKMFPNALTETITGYDEDGKPIVERAIDADVLDRKYLVKLLMEKMKDINLFGQIRKKLSFLQMRLLTRHFVHAEMKV